MPERLPNLDSALLGDLPPVSGHRPRILLLYGSTRERSFSRLLVLEAARLLARFGAETRIFDPSGLPLPDDAPLEHPKVRELRDLVQWSEGQVWCSPERHGALSAVFKAQIDWIPLALGAVRPTQGKTLALMQVCGGSQSFNVVNQLRVLGRWMRMFTIPNQGLPGVRRSGPDEAIALLRPGGRRDGGVVQVHPAPARAHGVPGEPLFGAQGKRRAAFRAGRPAFALSRVRLTRAPADGRSARGRHG